MKEGSWHEVHRVPHMPERDWAEEMGRGCARRQWGCVGDGVGGSFMVGSKTSYRRGRLREGGPVRQARSTRNYMHRTILAGQGRHGSNLALLAAPSLSRTKETVDEAVLCVL